MKCPKCHVTMEKDYDTRTATCPLCGKTKNYKSNADKKRGYRYYPDVDYTPISPLASFLGCLVFWGIIVLIIAIVFGILLLTGVFSNGFLDGIWQIILFFLRIIWAVISFIGKTTWNIITGLFHLVFG